MYQPLIKVHPFQYKAVQRSFDWVNQGKRRFVIELPTGSGKTRVAIATIRAMLRAGQRAIFITNSISLVNQAYKAFLEFNDAEDLGLVWASTKEFGRWITIASIDTLMVPGVMEQLLAAQNDEPFDFVYIDECEGAISKSYKKALAKLLKPEGVLIGTSATPFRADGKNLRPVFKDDVAFSEDYFYLVAKGYLANIKSKDIETNLDLSSLVVEGDVEGTQELTPALIKQLEESNRYEKAYQGWLDYAYGMRTLFFGQTLNDAWNFQKFIQQKGYECEVITGKTREGTRKKIFQKLIDGTLLFVANFGVLTTGIDLPRLQCIINGRMTESRGLWLQILGRLTRLCDEIGKTFGVFLNLTGQHFVACSMGSLIGDKEESEFSSVRRTLTDKIDADLACDGITKEEIEQWDIEMKVDYLKTRAYNIFTGDGWVGDPEIGTYTKDCGAFGRLETEQYFNGYIIHRIHPGGRSVALNKDPLPLEEAMATGAAHLERYLRKVAREDGTSAELQDDITPGEYRHLKNRNVPMPPNGVAPNGTRMTRGHYQIIKQHMDLYGGPFTEEGGCIGFTQDRFTGQWGISRWPKPKYIPKAKKKKSAATQSEPTRPQKIS